jgi:Cation transport ATPase
MESLPVVLRYRDGHTERAASAQTDVEQQLVRVVRDGEGPTDVPFAELKALFFPRLNPEEPLEDATGSTISVEFADGEVIRGVAHYNPASSGFTLFPHDRSKNERIFVVTSAIVSIEVEKL